MQNMLPTEAAIDGGSVFDWCAIMPDETHERSDELCATGGLPHGPPRETHWEGDEYLTRMIVEKVAQINRAMSNDCRPYDVHTRYARH